MLDGYDSNMKYVEKLVKFGTLPEHIRVLAASRFEDIEFLNLSVLANIVDNPDLFNSIATHSSLLDRASDELDYSILKKQVLYCPELDIVASCDSSNIRAIRDLTRGTHELINIQHKTKSLYILLTRDEYNKFIDNDGKVLRFCHDSWKTHVESSYFIHMMKFFYHPAGYRNHIGDFVCKYFQQKVEDFYYLAEDRKKAVVYFKTWINNVKLDPSEKSIPGIIKKYYTYAMAYHIKHDKIMFLSPEKIEKIIDKSRIDPYL